MSEYVVNDKTHHLFYNARAWNRAEDEEVRAVLRFIHDGKAESVFSQELEERVEDAKVTPTGEEDYMFFMDIVEEAKEEARAEAMQKGLEQGRTQAVRELALNMLRMNICSAEKIAQTTGLSLQDIETLAKGL